MAYNIPGDDALGSEDSPSLIKPIIIAFVAAFILLGGAFFLLATLDPPVTDRAAKPEAAASSSFSEGILKSFVPASREGCVKSAQAAMTRNGADVSADGVDAKIEAYCSCAIDHTATDLTVTQLMAFKLNPASEPAATKMKDIVRVCEGQIGEAGR
jgi:hypothetical protein